MNMCGNLLSPERNVFLKATFIMLVCLVAVSSGPISKCQAQNDEEVGKVFREIRTALFSGETEKAMNIANEAIKKYPERAEPYYFRARLWDHYRKFDRALEDANMAISKNAVLPDIWQLRGVLHFQLGEPKKSVADFDKYLTYRPGEAPHHWQRGISLYYAKEFQKGVEQFQIHKTVNPTDVENVFWHFICLAKAKSPEEASKQLIPLSPGDRRIPMKEIHGLLTGKNGPEEVIKAAEEAGKTNPSQKSNFLCYAHLYLGLYFEATGKDKLAQKHIKKSAVDFNQFHYMGDVARVHHLLLKKKEKSKSQEKKAIQPK